MKKTFKVLPVLAVGLLAQTTPAHADGSFFESLSQAFHKVTQTVREQINDMYGDDQQNSSAPQQATPVSEPTFAATPSPTPTGPSLNQCRRFLAVEYDPSYVTDPQKAATIYLNGLLDFMSANLDGKLSDEEIAERNKCVVLALDAGADPNSNAVYSDPDGMLKDVPVPLTRAVTDNDESAVKALLEHKADPNAVDSTMGKPIPLLRTALYGASQDIAIDLINAGADVTTPDLLWTAAGNADDQVVDLLLQTKKIPVNQVDKFTDFSDDSGETALDPSERGVYALKGYQKKYHAGSRASVQQKIEAVNQILYYIYPLKPQLKYPTNGNPAPVDPDTFISDLLTHQQNVSNALKAAGWKCQEENCGIVDLVSYDEDDGQNKS